jgi:hypothetical protein
MWVFYALLPTLIVLALIAGGIVLLVRRGSEGWSIDFLSVVLAYAATAMLVGVFMVAAGSAMLLKAGFAQAGSRDFSYDVQPQTVYQAYPPSGVNGTQRTVDPSDSAIRDDVASGISLTFAGGVLFAVHAFGAAVLRRRKVRGEQLVSRTYNLVGLAVATLGFLGSGAAALNDIMRRYVVGGDIMQPWQVRHPGEALAVAVAVLPLILWFGWRVWQEAPKGQEPAAGGVTGSTGAIVVA